MSLFTRFLSVLLILCLWVTPVLAKDALTPAEAPQIFVEAMYKLNYQTAWQILNGSTREHFVDTVLKMEKNNTLSKDQVEKYFNTADRALRRGFWTQFRRSMDILAWKDQTFTTAGPGPDGLVWVDVKPANIRVLAQQEGSNWKFALYESFIKQPTPTPPSPSPSP